MTFLNPLFLWGLCFTLIPVIVHFFDFRRTKRVLFSNILFLEHLNQDNIPRNRIREVLILISRVLAITCLVLAFSEPIITNDQRKVYSENHLQIDNSFSLTDQCKETDCLDRVKGLAVEYGQVAQSGTISNGNRHSRIFYSGIQDLQRNLTSLTYSKEDFLASGFSDQSSEKLNVIFSDFQADIVESLLDLSKDSAELLLVPVNRQSESNVYVDSVLIKAPFSVSTGQSEVVVKLHNSGSVKSEDVLIKLLGGGKQISSVVVSLESNQYEEVEFPIIPDGMDYEILIEDASMDFDNKFYFSVPAFKKPTIAILDEQNNRNLEALFSSSDIFESRYFNKENINFQSLLSSDLIVINGFIELPGWLDLDKIKTDVVIFPGESINLNNYSTALSFRVIESTDSSSRPISTNDFQNPFFDGIFENVNEKVNLPSVRVLYKSLGSSSRLLSANGELLVVHAQGDRSVYWFNTPIDDRFTNFHNHAIFLPIMYRIAEETSSVNDPLFYRLSSKPFSIGTMKERGEVLKLIGENGEFIPELYPNQNTMVMELPDEMNQAGRYYLVSGSDSLTSIALNYEKKESILDYRTAQDLEEIFADYKNVRIFESSGTGSLKAGLRTLDNGIPLWKYALILALMFLIAETAIHRSK